jgi:hypothetical protein
MWPLPIYRHYSGICLGCLRKIKVKLRQHGPSPGRDLKPDPLKCEARTLTSRRKKISEASMEDGEFS